MGRLHLLSYILLSTTLLLLPSFARANAPLDNDALTSLEAAVAGYVDPSFGLPVVDSSFGRPAWSNDLPKQEEEEGQRVTVRETVWVHQARPTPALPPSQPNTRPAKAEEPANILTTLSRLKPLFRYGVEHPLKFGYHYLLPSLLSLLLFLLRTLLTLLLTLLTPLQFLASLALAPLRTTYGILMAFSPLWISVLAALAIGSGLGAVAGMLTGESVRGWLEGMTRREGEAARFLRGVIGGERT